MLCGTFLDVFFEPAELSGGHLRPILGVSLSGGIFFLLCATCRIQIFFLVAGVRARAFYMFLELNLSSQVLCDCCLKRLSRFFHSRGADAERSVLCEMSTSGPAFWSQLFNLSGALGTICRCCVLCGIAAFVLLEPLSFFCFQQ